MKTSKMRLASSRARGVMAALLAGWVVAGLLVGCARTAPAAAANCGQYQYSAGSVANPDQPHPGGFKLVLILLDLYSNSPQTADLITRELNRYLQAAVAGGAYVKVDADGGAGTQLTTSRCFDGSQPFLVTRANAVAQQKTQASALTALDSALEGFIGSVKVSAQGSATRLLQGAPEQVSALRAGGPDPVTSVQVVLWSNLLGNAGKSDCLNVNGVPGTAAYAAAVAKRCFSERQLAPLPDAALGIFGVGTGAVNNQQSLLASDLASDLCDEYGASCQAFPA